MAIKESVLRDLSQQGHWVSGQQLAAKYGLSRPAIWKAIHALIQSGYEIDVQRGKGYRYQPSAKLDSYYLTAQSPQDWHWHVCDKTDSTNLQAKIWASQHVISTPHLFLANEQTQGTGRLGRPFYSPANSGLYLSLLIPVPKQLIPGLLTTGTAVAISEVLWRLYQRQLAFKWVNDLWYHQKKCGGILTEQVASLEEGHPQALIIGVGLNLGTDTFPDELARIATSLALPATLNRNELALALAHALLNAVYTHTDGHFLPFYRAHSVVLGHNIIVRVGHDTWQGRVTAIDDQAKLVITTEDGPHVLQSGEVTKVEVTNSQGDNS